MDTKCMPGIFEASNDWILNIFINRFHPDKNRIKFNCWKIDKFNVQYNFMKYAIFVEFHWFFGDDELPKTQLFFDFVGCCHQSNLGVQIQREFKFSFIDDTPFIVLTLSLSSARNQSRCFPQMFHTLLSIFERISPNEFFYSHFSFFKLLHHKSCVRLFGRAQAEQKIDHRTTQSKIYSNKTNYYYCSKCISIQYVWLRIKDHNNGKKNICEWRAQASLWGRRS